MNRRRILVTIALAALVAGAAALVYAQHRDGTDAGLAGLDELAADQTAPSNPAPGKDSSAKTEPAKPSGAEAQVLYDLNVLPKPVQRMLEQIGEAAASGDMEKMRLVVESNELKPMVATVYVEDPVAFWKKASADGSGRDILAAMLNVLSSGFVRIRQGPDEMFIWPYFAETDLTKLTPAQEVELYRIVPPAQAAPMKQAGKYGAWRLGISPSGVWHYFLQ